MLALIALSRLAENVVATQAAPTTIPALRVIAHRQAVRLADARLPSKLVIHAVRSAKTLLAMGQTVSRKFVRQNAHLKLMSHQPAWFLTALSVIAIMEFVS